MKKGTWHGLACALFLVAILGYGMFEMAVVPGQITVTLMGVMFYLTIADNLYRTTSSILPCVRL